MPCAPRTIRLDDDIERKVRLYCKKNDITINRLINLAVEKFISEKHVIEMKPLSEEDLLEAPAKDKKHCSDD